MNIICRALALFQIVLAHYEFTPEKKETSIIVTGFEVTSISDDIKKCKNLQKLVIDGTEISSLPPSIGELKRLKMLVITNNCKLKSLHPSIGELEELEILIIICNPELESLPSSIGQLQMLKELVVKKNSKLESLPSSIRKLKKLTDITIKIKNNPKLKSLPLPDELFKVPKLKISVTDDYKNTSLSNDDYESTSLSDEEECGSMEHLLKTNNYPKFDLESLPSSIGELKDLNKLFIRNNSKIESLPDKLNSVPGIKRLVTDDCKVTSLSDEEEYGSMEHLLKTNNYPRLRRLPEEFSNSQN